VGGGPDVAPSKGDGRRSITFLKTHEGGLNGKQAYCEGRRKGTNWKARKGPLGGKSADET